MVDNFCFDRRNQPRVEASGVVSAVPQAAQDAGAARREAFYQAAKDLVGSVENYKVTLPLLTAAYESLRIVRKNHRDECYANAVKFHDCLVEEKVSKCDLACVHLSMEVARAVTRHPPPRMDGDWKQGLQP
jgi:hypothetical protein